MKAAQLFLIDGQIDQSIDRFNKTAGPHLVWWDCIRMLYLQVASGGENESPVMEDLESSNEQ